MLTTDGDLYCTGQGLQWFLDLRDVVAVDGGSGTRGRCEQPRFIPRQWHRRAKYRAQGIGVLSQRSRTGTNGSGLNDSENARALFQYGGSAVAQLQTIVHDSHLDTLLGKESHQCIVVG
jgi:hypothetical protein